MKREIATTVSQLEADTDNQEEITSADTNTAHHNSAREKSNVRQAEGSSNMKREIATVSQLETDVENQEEVASAHRNIATQTIKIMPSEVEASLNIQRHSKEDQTTVFKFFDGLGSDLKELARLIVETGEQGDPFLYVKERASGSLREKIMNALKENSILSTKDRDWISVVVPSPLRHKFNAYKTGLSRYSNGVLSAEIKELARLNIESCKANQSKSQAERLRYLEMNASRQLKQIILENKRTNGSVTYNWFGSVVKPHLRSAFRYYQDYIAESSVWQNETIYQRSIQTKIVDHETKKDVKRSGGDGKTTEKANKPGCLEDSSSDKDKKSVTADPHRIATNSFVFADTSGRAKVRNDLVAGLTKARTSNSSSEGKPQECIGESTNTRLDQVLRTSDKQCPTAPSRPTTQCTIESCRNALRRYHMEAKARWNRYHDSVANAWKVKPKLVEYNEFLSIRRHRFGVYVSEEATIMDFEKMEINEILETAHNQRHLDTDAFLSYLYDRNKRFASFLDAAKQSGNHYLTDKKENQVVEWQRALESDMKEWLSYTNTEEKELRALCSGISIQ
eukprot:CAMPEP_0202447868 /NCGR_PEP_ID=MMETSP1360-20130828/6632_1 /ASSEMBLY_ACC=CAM_ASM_000848 /TAXON_ID=515479 /ORGANISM="Licmophora paradoxa, Strain CCMP2313" /LENGTH=565 /DNA_ID=CAMNT_0049065153 /DNA_START=14 /DNA_END=1711 /DNA_ORIENTATION=+